MQSKETIVEVRNLIIPPDWRFLTLDDICDVLDSKRIPLNSEERSKIVGDIPYYGANGIQGFINKHIFDQDLVLLAEDGGYFDDYQYRPIAYYVKGKCWVNNHAHVLTNKPGFDLKWIFYSLVHKNILPWIKGTTRSKLNQSELKKITIPIPPLVEQQKIASILSTIEELIQKTDQIIELTQRLKKGLMQRLFVKGIGHSNFKETPIGVIPYEWKLTLSGNLFSFVTSGSRDWAKYYSKTGSIMIRIANLDHDTIYLDYTNIQRVIPPPGVEGIRTRVKPNDILVSITADVGMVAVVPDPAPEAYVNSIVKFHMVI